MIEIVHPILHSGSKNDQKEPKKTEKRVFFQKSENHSKVTKFPEVKLKKCRKKQSFNEKINKTLDTSHSVKTIGSKNASIRPTITGFGLPVVPMIAGTECGVKLPTKLANESFNGKFCFSKKTL